jgi:hypothetical protein
MLVNLKSVVSKQIPEFIRADYPLFVEFIEAYYEYLSAKSFTSASKTYLGGNQQRNLEQLRDLDDTLDEFIQYFKNELDVFGDNYEFIDRAFFLRKAKQVFTAKGTEASYKFLFKILYNKDAQIAYPWDQVLKASDGKWQQEMSIFVDIATGNAFNLVGNRINLNGPNLAIKVFVTRVELYSGTVYQLFIDKNYYGTIQTGYTINDDGITGTIIPTTVKYEILNKGTGFKVGTFFETTTIADGKTITQKLKVTGVDTNGGITGLTTIQFGAGYTLDFFSTKNVSDVISDSSITIDKDSTRQFSIPDSTLIDKYVDYGYLISPIYSVLDYSDNTYAGVLLNQWYQQTDAGLNEVTNFVIIKFTIGAVAKYQGQFINNDGFLDDDMYIQDSKYYQKYSYVITINENLNKYGSLIKSYIHPAGTALFSNYQIQSTFTPTIGATFELGEWISGASVTNINRSIRDMYVYPADAGGVIRLDAYDLDYVKADEFYNPPRSYRFYGDARNVLRTSVTVDDSGSAAVSIVFNAVTSVDDALETITYVNHGFITQDAVVYRTNGGTAVGGLSNLNTYYVYKVDNDTIKLATSASNAAGAVTINLTDGVGSNHTLTKTETF